MIAFIYNIILGETTSPSMNTTSPDKNTTSPDNNTIRIMRKTKPKKPTSPSPYDLDKMVLSNKFIPVESHIKFYFDGSGSQNDSAPFLKEMCKYLSENINAVNIKYLVFGGNKYQISPFNKYNNSDELYITIERIVLVLNMKKPPNNTNFPFDTRTDTELIDKSFTNMDTTQPLHLVFQCDGEFNGIPLQQVLDNHKHKFLNVKSILILFSPHTKMCVMDILVKEIKAIMELCPSYIEFKYQLMKTDITELCTYINNLSTEGQNTPLNCMNWQGLIINRAIPTYVFLNYIITVPQLIEKIKADFIHTIISNPNVFMHDNIYTLLYAALKSLIKINNDMYNIQIDILDWLSTYITTLNDDNQNKIKILTSGSKMRDADVQYQIYLMSQNAVGKLIFSENISVLNELREALNDGDPSKLHRLVNRLIKHIHCIPRKNKEEYGPGICCYPSLSECTSDEARCTLGNLFISFGSFIVNGIKVIIMALTILTTDAEIPTVLRTLCERIIFNHNELNVISDIEHTKLYLKLFGFVITDNNEVDINPIWYSYDMTILLYKSIELYWERMFPIIIKLEPSEEELLYINKIKSFKETLKCIIKNYTIVYSIKFISNQFNFYRYVEIPNSNNPSIDLQKGDLCIVDHKSWGNKTIPFDTMPNIGLIVGAHNRNGKTLCMFIPNFHAQLLNNPTDSYPIKRKYLKYITRHPRAIQEICTYLEECLTVFPRDVNGVYHDPIQDTTTASEKMEYITEIIKSHDLEFKLGEYITKLESFNLSVVEVCKLLNLNNFISICKKPCPKRDEILDLGNDTSIVLQQTFTISRGEDVFSLTRDELDEILNMFHNSQVIRITESIGTRSKYCPMCLDECNGSRCVILGCGHSMCDEHMDVMIPNYNKGDFIDPIKHHCPQCKAYITVEIMQQYAKERLSWIPFYIQIDYTKDIGRFCNDCNRVFIAGEKSCNDNRDEFPNQCEECRKPLSFSCPGCSREYQFAGGCHIMRCCIHGYHGCKDDIEYDDNGDPIDIEYDDNGYPIEVEPCNHGGGCGHVWSISDLEKNIGN